MSAAGSRSDLGAWSLCRCLILLAALLASGCGESALSVEVRQTIARRLQVDPSAVTPEKSLEELGASESQALSVMTELEQSYGIEFPEPEIRRRITEPDAWRTLKVSDLVEMLHATGATRR